MVMVYTSAVYRVNDGEHMFLASAFIVCTVDFKFIPKDLKVTTPYDEINHLTNQGLFSSQVFENVRVGASKRGY